MTIKQMIAYIISAIDLNYILAEAKRENYCVTLTRGELDKKIKWSKDKCYLSYNYELSANIIYRYIVHNHDKIIKLNVSSSGNYYSLNRNMVIYLPDKIDINEIKKECESIVMF